MFENGKPMTFETNVAYPIGEKDGIVKCLYKNKLYTLQKINQLNLTAKEFVNGLLKDKFKQNTNSYSNKRINDLLNRIRKNFINTFFN